MLGFTFDCRRKEMHENDERFMKCVCKLGKTFQKGLIFMREDGSTKRFTKKAFKKLLVKVARQRGFVPIRDKIIAYGQKHLKRDGLPASK